MNQDTTPVFGLAESQLRSVVENVVGETVTELSVALEEQLAKELQGGFGDYMIPAISYRCSGGASGSVVLFAKRQKRIETHECPHYTHLCRHGAPVPRLFGCLQDAEGREVLFLEHLVPFNDNEADHLADPERFRQFLAASARFKAVPLSEGYRGNLEDWDMERTLIPATWKPSVTNIWAAALRGELGPELGRLCADNEDQQQPLRKLADVAADRIRHLPQGINHGDHRLGNAGWRRTTGAMVFYDLGVFLGPRFDDVANYLGGSANAGRKVEHVAEENVSTRPTTCSGPPATRQVG